MKHGFVVRSLVLLFVIGLAASSATPSSATAQSVENAVTQSHAFYIGQSYGGGIIFWIDATGQHGLIADKSDTSYRMIIWGDRYYLITGATGTTFHGAIRVNGENLPDGLLVVAWINGEAYASGYIWTDRGNSVYSLEVPGDDPDTPEREGGREGDTVQFELGGVLADQAGTWHSRTSVQLDLTLLASGVSPTMMPTISPDQSPTQTPTQTPGPVILPSPTTGQTPQSTFQTSPTPTLTPTSFSQPSPTPGRTPQPTFQTSPAPSSPSLVPVWTASPTTQASQGASSLPVPTQTFVPTRQPSPTRMSSPVPTGTPIPSGQSPPASIPSATAVRTLEPAAQLSVTSVSSPTATRTAIPPARPGTKLVVPQSPETGDFGDPMVGILLIAAALGLVLVMSIVITAGVIVSYIRQPR
jgi:hypothetical protein